MGCLMEIICEIFFEGLIELLGHLYLKLMNLIVPKKTFSQKTEKIVKNVATIFGVILALTLIIGLFLLIPNEENVKTTGKYMVFISLFLIVLQILLGIIASTVSFFQKKKRKGR